MLELLSLIIETYLKLIIYSGITSNLSLSYIIVNMYRINESKNCYLGSTKLYFSFLTIT